MNPDGIGLLLALSLSTVLAACSAAPDSPSNETTEAEGTAVEVATRGPCPSSLPRNGSSCSQDQLLCSWGSDTRFGCREEARCENGAWTNLSDTCPPHEPSCPRSAPRLVDGGQTDCSAADLGITCVYGETAYTCAPCEGNLCFTKNLWQTKTLPAGCPAKLPNFGQSCSAQSGTLCNYNICADDYNVSWVFGESVECEKGIWTAYADTICL